MIKKQFPVDDSDEDDTIVQSESTQMKTSDEAMGLRLS